VTIDPVFTQVRKIIPSDGADFDYFGASVAIDGDTVVVGASGNIGDGSNSGSAYIFDRNQGGTNNWGEVKRIIPSDGAANDEFGGSVAIYGDTVVVGAAGKNIWPDGPKGAAYIFQRDQGGTNNWGEVKILTSGPPDFYFGCSVAIDGDTVIIGAYKTVDLLPCAGSAYIFYRDHEGADNWGLVKRIVHSEAGWGERFGYSVAIDGNTLVIGAPYNDDNGPWSGAAYVFDRDQGGPDNWGEVQKITASDGAKSDEFGSSVTIDGNTVVVGAYRNDDNVILFSGAAYVFDRDQGGPDNWGEVQKITASDTGSGHNFGSSVAIDGGTVVIGEPRGNKDIYTSSGVAYVFLANCLQTWYRDGDSDGWGDPSNSIESCTPPEGYVAQTGDCDDNDNTVYPGAPELCDGVDNDCDGQIDDGLSTDADGDGHYTIGSCLTPADDCDDGNPYRYPGNPETCDGMDNDCDGQIDEGLSTDADGDWHYTVGSCATPADDCDDDDSNNYPGNAETCDGRDNDCDGIADNGLPLVTYYYDGDRDGFGDRENKVEACGPSGNYDTTDRSDCDDTTNTIGSCNTPPGSDQVTVTDPATGTEITFPNVENGGNTTVVASDVGADPPPNFQLGDFEYSYYDINCQTGDGSDCTWSHSSFVLVCFTWEEGDFIFDDFVRIFQENEGRWDDVTCQSGFGECPDPNPDTENKRVCAYVDHLSWFGVFQNIGLEISLAKGLNFISYAGEVPSGLSSHTLLKQLGTPDTIERILTYSPTSGTYSVSFYDTEGNPAGDDGMVTNFWALQVYAKQQQDARFFYTSLCQHTPLIKGRNEAGFNCIPPGYSAYKFLQDIGQSAVVSVQRFNKITGLFETASFKDGAPVGVDFPMQEGEGYIVFMKQNYVWIAP